MLRRKLLSFLILVQKLLMMITAISAREPESKLMNNSSTVVGELDNGLLSINAIDFQLKIPNECQETNICQHIPDYPQEKVSNIIAELQSQGIHLTYDNFPKWIESDKDLCHSVREEIFPQAVRDRNNKWHLALNSPEVPQKIIARKCETTSHCSPLIVFKKGYTGSCDQRYVPRDIIALDLPMKNVITISTPVASCCICVAKKVKYYTGN